MAKGYLLSQADRDALAAFRAKERREPVNAPLQEHPAVESKAHIKPEVYVTVPPETLGIPARVGDVPGERLDCCLFMLSSKTDGSYELRPVVDRDGKNIRITVYNIYDEEVTPAQYPNEYYIHVERDKFGRWLCESPLKNKSRTTTSTSTTTTTAHLRSITASCNGFGRWTWSSSSKQWVLNQNTCSVPTTTTTTSTSSTTTSKCCPLSDDQAATSTTTTTTSTTTTTAYTCTPAYPAFCGKVDSECTYTPCVPTVLKGKPPECGQSSTTTTSTTSTTQAGSGGVLAHWVCTPIGWRLDPDYPVPECPPNTTLLILIGSNCTPCETQTTGCVGGVPPPPPTCDGTCDWMWYSGEWFLYKVNGNCNGQLDFGLGCICGKPTQGGTVDCGTQTTTCGISGTTTTNCNAGYCIYRGNGSGGWILDQYACPDSCPCGRPAHDSTGTCERTRVPCGGGTTTTTTSTTTTTGTTTTSTSTTTTSSSSSTTSSTSTTTTSQSGEWWCVRSEWQTCEALPATSGSDCIFVAGGGCVGDLCCYGPYTTQSQCLAACKIII